MLVANVLRQDFFGQVVNDVAMAAAEVGDEARDTVAQAGLRPSRPKSESRGSACSTT